MRHGGSLRPACPSAGRPAFLSPLCLFSCMTRRAALRPLPSCSLDACWPAAGGLAAALRANTSRPKCCLLINWYDKLIISKNHKGGMAEDGSQRNNTPGIPMPPVHRKRRRPAWQSVTTCASMSRTASCPPTKSCNPRANPKCCSPARTEQVNEHVLRQLAPTLRYVATLSVGYDHIDMAAARELGIGVLHTPDVLSDALRRGRNDADAQCMPPWIRSGPHGARRPLAGMEPHPVIGHGP